MITDDTWSVFGKMLFLQAKPTLYFSLPCVANIHSYFRLVPIWWQVRRWFMNLRLFFFSVKEVRGAEGKTFQKPSHSRRSRDVFWKENLTRWYCSREECQQRQNNELEGIIINLAKNFMTIEYILLFLFHYREHE